MGDTGEWGECLELSNLTQLSLTAHTHNSYSDNKGQHDAQWEGNDVIHDCVHDGSKSLLPCASQNSTKDTLDQKRREKEQ